MTSLSKKDVGDRWSTTNLGAILFATDLKEFGGSLERKVVSQDGVDGTTLVTHRVDNVRGYASGFKDLLSYINGLLLQSEHIGQDFWEKHLLFPELSIREALANALIHQDMTITVTGPLIELFEDRIEITNPGAPLVATDRMTDLTPRSRNGSLASLLRRMGMCEEQGSGLDKVFLYGPRTFAEMSEEERVRAWYFHAVLQFMGGKRMKNATLCQRFGIDTKNAAQASAVLKKALYAGLIKFADEDRRVQAITLGGRSFLDPFLIVNAKHILKTTKYDWLGNAVTKSSCLRS